MWNQEEFIKTCDENIKIISQAYKDTAPVKLNSYSDFGHWENKWWNDFRPIIKQKVFHKKKKDDSYGMEGFTKFRIETKVKNIPIIKLFSKHLFSKIFSEHKITAWGSVESYDRGTMWHEDYEYDNITPTYLICINLIGDTHWKFKKYDDINLSAGELLCQNGSMAHNVKPIGQRFTIAGHSSIKNIIL